MKDFTKATELNPAFADAFYNRGTLYHNLGIFHQAVKDLDKAIELNPKNASAYYNRGAVYGRLGDKNKEASDYNKAIDLHAEKKAQRETKLYSDEPSKEKLGLQKELPAATDVKERQPRADEQKTVSDLTAIDWFKKGYSFALSGKYEEAVGAYDKSVALNLNFVEAYYVRGVAYYHLGDPKRAIQDLDRAIELNGTYAEAHFMKGLAFNKLGNPGKATENYIVAARLGMKTAQDHLKGQGIAW